MPLINRCGGGGGTPQLCGQVENFEAKLGNLSVILSWTAPSPDEDNSFVGARIVRKTGSAPTSINDGTVVYEGTALSYTDTGLTAGTTYYYRAFAYNAKKKYQTAYRVINRTAMAIQTNFADNTWDAIIEACHADIVPDTWITTDSKTMAIGETNYQIDIIGKNHDTYAAGGTAPLTFQLHDCYVDRENMDTSSATGTAWTSCAMRQMHLPAILSLMPTEVQNGIREVNKPTQRGFNSNIVDTVADKLFLLSESEVSGSNSAYSKVNEGEQYDYYKAGNSKVKKVGSSATWWWLRSLLKADSGYYCIVDTDGSITNAHRTASGGIPFAFCF